MKRPSAPGSSNSSSAGSFCAELYGWGFDASHSLGLGDTAGTSSSSSSSATSGAPSSTTAAGAEQGSSSSGLSDLVHGPRRIPLDRLVALERVQSVACSSQHSLLLTAMGSVFACGENSEGALGTGDFLSR
jgi:alpha-tubulin suppressor-like RCC1 family protein